jgi:sulfur-carrier protein
MVICALMARPSLSLVALSLFSYPGSYQHHNMLGSSRQLSENQVFVPTPLRSYTGHADEVGAHGSTVAELLADLDRRFPGIRFRIIDEQDAIRPHMRIFVNGEEVRGLDSRPTPAGEVQILQALSGG